MLNLKEAIETEKKLERKYQGVIGYVEAKQFLAETGYTAAKIRGALTRYCKHEDVERPATFLDMESFVIDFADWWLDENIEIHQYGERKLHDAVSNYLAFVTVWKAKSKSLSIYTPELMRHVGAMLVIKNTFAHAIKIGYSYAKRKENLAVENVREGFLQGFTAMLPYVQGIESGKIELSNELSLEPLTRLIGAYMAGDPNVLGMADKLTQIENKEE